MAPKPEAPIYQLISRVQETKYGGTDEEIRAFIKLKGERNGALLQGVILGFGASFYGTSAAKLKGLNRATCVIVTTVLSMRFFVRKAMDNGLGHILDCSEQSPLRGELIEILRRDFPAHPLLDAVEKTQKQKRAALLFDENGEKPLPRLPLKEPVDANMSSGQDHVWGKDARMADSSDLQDQKLFVSQTPQQQSRAESDDFPQRKSNDLWNNGTNKDEFLVDPFALAGLSRTNDASENKSSRILERKKKLSQMDREERKLYLHERYLEWKSKNGLVQQGSHE